MKARTRILGVGSPFGDDRIGWLAADFIRASTWYRSGTAGAVSVESLDRPGAGLLVAMAGASHAVLIDAVLIDTVQGIASPGRLHHVELGQLAPSADKFISGHTLGLAETLMLGNILHLLPPRLTLIAVEADRVDRDDDSLSDAVRAALPDILHCVEACVNAGQGVLDEFCHRRETARGR